MDILSQLDHPNVVKLYEIFDEQEVMYLVMELMTGGEVSATNWLTVAQLFDRIVEKEHYSEKEASDTIRPIVDAIRYYHGLGIIHRDLKVSLTLFNIPQPENLLYASRDDAAIIKISDFGLARFL